MEEKRPITVFVNYINKDRDDRLFSMTVMSYGKKSALVEVLDNLYKYLEYESIDIINIDFEE